MSNINKAAVLNPFSDLTGNILDYIPRASTSEFGIVALGSGVNVDALGRIYLDDAVLEYLNVAAFPPIGETGKIYVETTGNTTYRWSGSGYVKITSGEVLSVAGKTGVVTLTKGDVELGNVNNTSDMDKPVSTAQAAAINTSASNLTILIKDSLRQSVEAASGGEQTVLYTAKGQPTHMNIIQKFDLSTIDASLSGTHPAFIVDGVEKPEIFIGTYQGKIVSGELLSLPNVDPTVYTNFTNFLAAARASGNGHHLITNAEWSAVALQCYKKNQQPLGNSYYGRSSEDPLLVGRRADGLNPGDTSGSARTLTGSGPVEWRHNRKPSGIADLSGNVWEWNAGMRLVNGEIQVIADNNAALPTIDMGESSAQWKAIDGETGNLVTPDGNGTTVGTVKYANSGTADYTINGASFGAIQNLSTTKPVTAVALAKLKALCLYPHIASPASYNGDQLYKYLTAECVPIRGGLWNDAATAGVFALYLGLVRSSTYPGIGARPAFVNL